jgi:hypothetical protein
MNAQNRPNQKAPKKPLPEFPEGNLAALFLFYSKGDLLPDN